MRTLDGTGLAKRGAGGPSGGARRGPLAAALLGITLLCCLFGLPAAAGAAPRAVRRRAPLCRTSRRRPFWRGSPCSKPC